MKMKVRTIIHSRACRAKAALFSLVLVFFSLLNTKAQNTREQVTIIGTFQPSLKEAVKINVLPGPAENPLPVGNQQLSNVETTVEVRIDPEPISPVLNELSEVKSNYRNYLNLGFGSNLSPVFNFHHRSQLSKTLALNVSGIHRSSWTTVRDYAPSQWMNNKARVAADLDLGEQSLQTGFAYKHDRVHWYGFKPADYPAFGGNGKDIRQDYSLFSADALWQTKFRDPESVNHYLGLNLDFFGDRYKTFEHAFAVKGGAKKKMDLFSIDGQQFARIDAKVAYIAEGDSTMEKSTLLIQARPAAGLNGSFYALEAALELSSAQAEKTYFNLFPELNGNLYIFKDRMSVFASFGGSLEHHSRTSLRNDNPYLRSTDSSYVTTVPAIFEAGIKGNPLRGLEIMVSYSYMTAEQMGFFASDTTSAFKHMYTMAFDDMSRNRFTAEVRYDHGSKARAELIVHFNKYEMASLSHPWHLPKTEWRFNGWYNINDKIQLNTGLLVLSGRYAPAPGNSAQKLKDVVDINIGGQYRFNQQLWFYADLSNLLNQRYFRFDNYPVQGAQLTAGMKLNF